MTAQRASEIITASKAPAGFYNWSDNIDKHITPAEREFVNRVWSTMPGHTSFVDALFRIQRGRVS